MSHDPIGPLSCSVSVLIIFFYGARCYYLVVPLLTASGPGNRPLLATQVAATAHARYLIYLYLMRCSHYCAGHRRQLVPFSLWVGLGVGALWGTAITNTNLKQIYPISEESNKLSSSKLYGKVRNKPGMCVQGNSC